MIRRSGMNLSVCGVLLALTACPQCRDEPGPVFEDGKITEILVWPNGSVRDTLFWEYDDNQGGKWVQGFPTDADEEANWGEPIVTVTTLPPYQPSPGSQPQVAARRAENSVVALYTGGRNPRTGANAVRNAMLYLPGNGPFKLNMVVARAGHRSSPLPGERSLIVGGYGAAIPTNYLNSAEIFTFSSRTFAATGSLQFARAYHAQAELADGRVIVTGGLVPVGAGPVTDLTATTEIYNPVTGTFSAGPAMITARSGHSAITLNDGRILVLGGADIKNVEVYTPATNTFTAVGSMASAHGNGLGVVKLPSGKVLVVGGDATHNIQPSAIAELFDPATNTFTTLPNMTTPRMQHFAVLMENGKVLVGGGRTTGGDPVATTEIYDPSANTFTRGADMPGTSYDQTAVAIRRPGN